MKNINKILITLIAILLIIIILIDKDTLNSLFINYNEYKMNEIKIASVDNNKVIYKEIPKTISQTTETVNAKPINKVSSNDYWAWPTDKNYTITSHYSTSHKALDIYSYTGYASNIYAANNGVVSTVKSGCTRGYLSCNGSGGNYIIINHNRNNYYTVYMHLKDIKVKVGDIVSRGQVIGTMGNTGNVIPVPTAKNPYLGTHLHFALYIGKPYQGGYAINPMRLY